MPGQAASHPKSDYCRACIAARGRTAAPKLLRELAHDPVLGLGEVNEEG